MNNLNYCYMCNCEANTREHVPPKNLFPEAKDVAGNYRNNLITVPSCEKHNSAKSSDDEFLMINLAGIFGNNSIGYQHKLTKVDRALRRNSSSLLKKLMNGSKIIKTVEISKNKFVDIIWGTPDAARLQSCFDHIARGIHFHHFGMRFPGKIQIFMGYLFFKERNSKKWAEFIHDRAELDLKDKPKYGENAEIFYYQVSDFDEFGLFMMRFCFYGGLHVYASFMHPSATPPFNLAGALLNEGLPVIFTLGSKSYKFNSSDKNN